MVSLNDLKTLTGDALQIAGRLDGWGGWLNWAQYLGLP